MQAEIAGRLVADIIARTFPVTVIARDGERIVLSQGGQTVREGTRYRVVRMGREMFDPQTGQSLGCVEEDCSEHTDFAHHGAGPAGAVANQTGRTVSAGQPAAA